MSSIDPDIANFNYLVICDKVDGLGDLSCGFKVANDLHERLSVPLENITFVSNDLANAKLFNKYNFRIEDSTSANIVAIVKTNQIALQIVVPTDTYFASSKIVPHLPALGISEYGFESAKSSGNLIGKSLGLGKGEIGVLIDHSLAEWGFSERATNPLYRLEHLVLLSSNLQKAILSEQIGNPISEFNENNILYIAYAPNRVLINFVKQISIETATQKKNLTFVMPNFKLPLEADKLDVFYNDLIRQGIGSITIANTNAEILKKIEFGCGKNLTIITGSVMHSDMLTLFKAAERKTVVTGDQSLSEAISANMNFVYVAPSHKQKLGDDLADLKIPVLFFEYHPLPKFAEARDITNINRFLCDRDYFPNFEILISEKRGPIIAPTSLIHLSGFESFISAIQKNIKYIVNLSQLCMLRIESATNKSTLPQFGEGVFQCSYLGNDHYAIELA